MSQRIKKTTTPVSTTTTTTSDGQIALAMATLKRLAQGCSPDALLLAIAHAARDVGMPFAEAEALLAPLQQTQRSSVMHRLFWSRS